MQVMIMVSEAGRMENTCNLPADLDKNGTVTYNGKRWTFDKKQSST